MIVLECLALSIALCQSADGDAVGRLDALDRDGTHHAILTGRVLSADGSPAIEVLVQATCTDRDRTCSLRTRARMPRDAFVSGT
jgi:hypothetical protein